MEIWDGAAVCVGMTRQPVQGVEDLICGGNWDGDGRSVAFSPGIGGKTGRSPIWLKGWAAVDGQHSGVVIGLLGAAPSESMREAAARVLDGPEEAVD
jgi:hypothetical protein